MNRQAPASCWRRRPRKDVALISDVVGASRTGPVRVDMTEPRSIEQLFATVHDIDAVVCCAASVPLAPLATVSEPDFTNNLQGKLFGQVSLTRQALSHLNDGGSITLTSGTIPPLSGSTAIALANAGLEAFVRAAALEMPRGIRINAVCPGWVKETLTRMGYDSAEGTPAIDVARAFVTAVTGNQQGQILTFYRLHPALWGRQGDARNRVIVGSRHGSR